MTTVTVTDHGDDKIGDAYYGMDASVTRNLRFPPEREQPYELQNSVEFASRGATFDPFFPLLLLLLLSSSFHPFHRFILSARREKGPWECF